MESSGGRGGTAKRPHGNGIPMPGRTPSKQLIRIQKLAEKYRDIKYGHIEKAGHSLSITNVTLHNQHQTADQQCVTPSPSASIEPSPFPAQPVNSPGYDKNQRSSSRAPEGKNSSPQLLLSRTTRTSETAGPWRSPGNRLSSDPSP